MPKRSEQSNINAKTLKTFKHVETHFSVAQDYRCPGSVKHELRHIIFFTLGGITTGANDLVDISPWVLTHKEWLVVLFKLKYGVPSMSTMRMTFILLDPKSFSMTLW